MPQSLAGLPSDETSIEVWAYARNGLGPFVSASIRGSLVRVERVEPFHRVGSHLDVVLEVAKDDRARWTEAFNIWQPLQWPPAFWPQRLVLGGGIWTLHWNASGQEHQRRGVGAGPYGMSGHHDGWAPPEFESLLDDWVRRAHSRRGRSVKTSAERIPKGYASANG